MSTFGKTTIGGTQDGFPGASYEQVFGPYTLATPGTVSKLSVYLTPTNHAGSQSGLLKGLIYADSAGSPAARQAVGDEINVTYNNSGPAAWVDLTMGAGVALAAANYWIGWIADSQLEFWTFAYDTGAAGIRKFKATTYGNSTDPFGTPDGSDTEQASLYATYTASGGGGAGRLLLTGAGKHAPRYRGEARVRRLAPPIRALDSGLLVVGRA